MESAGGKENDIALLSAIHIVQFEAAAILQSTLYIDLVFVVPGPQKLAMQ